MCDRVIWLDHGRIQFDGPSRQAEKLYLSTVPSIANFRRGEELIQLAECSPRSEVIVRGSSGNPQLFLVRDGRRHFIATTEWCNRHDYVERDVTLVDDSVILELPEGDVLS
jgi:hypothetical protein